jgi:hypothetical protein
MLNSVFNALMSGASQGGAQPTGGQSQAGGGVLGDVLGSLMGGQPSGNQPASQSSGNPLSGMLGSLLGGGQTGASQPASQSSGSDLVSSLLGSFMGGGQTGSNPVMNLVNSGSNPMVNSLVQPVANTIAQKLGISPAIAMTVVTFAIHYMLQNHGTKLAKGEDLSGVLQQHTNQKFLQSSGVSKQLAQQTGMKPKAAANALSEVFKLL